MTESDNSQVAIPVRGKERNKSLDVVRGFAVLGILLVNIYFAAAPLASMNFLFMMPDVTQADLHAWTFMQVGLIGLSRGLFSLMFGVGMMLLLDRIADRFDDKQLKKFFMRRMGLLFALGIFHIFGLLWFGDILNVYALCGMLLYFLRNASTKKLAIFALIFGLIASAPGIGMSFGVSAYEDVVAIEASGEELTAEQEALKAGMGPMFDPEQIAQADAEFSDAILGDFGGAYVATAMLSLQFLLMNLLMVMWDSMFMMVIGIWMYRKGWLTNEASTATYMKMIVIGFGVGLGLRIYWFYQFWQQGYEMDYFILNMAWAQPTRLFIAVGVIGVIQLFCRAAIANGIKDRIAAVGQMALTNYMSHSIIFFILFYGVGFGLYNSLSGWAVFAYGLIIFIAQMFISPLWLKYYRFGPVEWLWRSMTYGKKQPLKR